MNAESSLFLAAEFLCKSVAILGAAALLECVATRRASAAHRHLIWIAPCVALLVLPLSKLATPRWTFSLQRAPAPLAITLPAQEVITSFADSNSEATISRPASHWHSPEPPVIALATWVAGSALLLGYRLLGSIQLLRLQRRAGSVDSPEVQKLASHVAMEFGVRRRVTLRESAACQVPLTWGVMRPMILLPTDALAWPREQLVAALRHEFAHIARHDYLIRLLGQIAGALYWPNPLVWFARRRLRALQEEACDDLVLRAGTPAQQYARQLVEIVRGFAGSPVVGRHALPMAQSSTLERRVIAIVDDSRDRRPLNRAGVCLAAVASACALGASALAQVAPASPAKTPRSQPQDTPPSEATAPASGTAAKAQRIIIPRIEFHEATLREAIDFLTKKSVDLDTEEQDPAKRGINFILKLTPETEKARITLRLTNIPFIEAARYVAALGNLQVKIEPFAISMQPQGDGVKKDVEKPADVERRERTALPPSEAKAQSIIIPKLEFRDASIVESVDFLRRKAVDLDAEKRGVNIVLAGGFNPETRITISLSNIPLSEALKYVAGLGNLSFEWQKEALVLKPEKGAAPALPPPNTQPPPAIPGLESVPAPASPGIKGGPFQRIPGLEPIPVPSKPEAQAKFEDLPINISAEEMRMENGITHAIGGAKLVRKDVTVSADELNYDPATKAVVAEGHVVLKRINDTIVAEDLFYDLATDKVKTIGPSKTTLHDVRVPK